MKAKWRKKYEFGLLSFGASPKKKTLTSGIFCELIPPLAQSDLKGLKNNPSGTPKAICHKGLYSINS